MAKYALGVVTAHAVVERPDAGHSLQASDISLLVGLVPVARGLPDTRAVILELFFKFGDPPADVVLQPNLDVGLERLCNRPVKAVMVET